MALERIAIIAGFILTLGGRGNTAIVRPMNEREPRKRPATRLFPKAKDAASRSSGELRLASSPDAQATLAPAAGTLPELAASSKKRPVEPFGVIPEGSFRRYAILANVFIF